MDALSLIRDFDIILHMNKRTTEINNGLYLTEYTDGLLFGTDALFLSRFVKGGKNMRGVDIGVGSGPVSLLLLSENKAAHMTGIDIQERCVGISAENALNNGYADRFDAVLGDVREPIGLFPVEAADFVVSNPPFMKAESGFLNSNEAKSIARHEQFLPAFDLCKAASHYLKYGGCFYVVYRPERVCTLISALKDNSLEPKTMRFLVPNGKEKPSLVLICAKKGGAEGVDISFETV